MLTKQESGAVTINLAWQMKGNVGREGVRGSRTPGLTPHPPRLEDPEAGRALPPRDVRSGARPARKRSGRFAHPVDRDRRVTYRRCYGGPRLAALPPLLISSLGPPAYGVVRPVADPMSAERPGPVTLGRSKDVTRRGRHRLRLPGHQQSRRQQRGRHIRRRLQRLLPAQTPRHIQRGPADNGAVREMSTDCQISTLAPNDHLPAVRETPDRAAVERGLHHTASTGPAASCSGGRATSGTITGRGPVSGRLILMVRSSFRDRLVLRRASRSTVSTGRFDVRSRRKPWDRDADCSDGPTPHRPLASTNALRGSCVTLCAGSGRPVTARRGTPTAPACPGSPSSTRSPIRTGRSTSGRTGRTRSPTSAASTAG